MGLLIVFMVFAIAWTIYQVGWSIWQIIKAIALSIAYGIRYVIFKQALINPLEKSGLLEKERAKQRQCVLEEQERLNKEKSNAANKVALAAINTVNQLRFKYPYADERLFQIYLNKFYDMNILEIQKLEQEISNSNDERKSANKTQDEYFYSLYDIDNVTPIEKKVENPIELSLYRMDETTYVLHLFDSRHDKHWMFQTKNYIRILKFTSKILQNMQELKQRKQNIKAVDVDSIIYDSKEPNIIQSI